ncbi:NB-ARC domain-containing protein [Nocardia macrotermitis]|uniref:NB-ARC domain-containing protein n=1 Tax=Nocardia macrotermitis TaxID=2585198 RepID=A0A7K0DDN9_9NOCA|nr:NB-ARC domain-containing protein [Nocardia macrotermitis]MQY23422.1 hypothetical protein [Nocardia macrotermitis]
MVVPHEVLLAPRDFVNRKPALEWSDGFWADDSGHARVGVCSGLPGVGKTAFVRRSVEKAIASGRFADGQLCVEFGSGPGERTSVSDGLAACLAALGIATDAIPSSLKERSNRLRSITAEKSVLIVLEDVTDAAQVVPFVPGGPTSAVLVTSNKLLTELVLDGAWGHHLEPLDGIAGTHLLTALVGERVEREPLAVAELVRRCAGLPVALKLTAARLLARPSLRVEALVASIDADDSGVAPFTRAGWEKVTAVFSESYEALDGEAARLFRLLGIFPGRDLAAETLDVLLDRGPVVRDAAIYSLIDAGFLVEDSAGRMSLHPLLSQYAAQLSEYMDHSADREAALARVASHLVRRAAQADRKIMGEKRFRCTPDEVATGAESPFADDRDDTAAYAWFEVERANLLDLQRVVAAKGWHDWSWQLAEALSALYSQRRYFVDWTVSSEIGAASAHRAGNVRAEARLRSYVSRPLLELEQFERAHDELLVKAFPLAEAIGEGRLLGSVWEMIGRYRDVMGDPAGALEAYTHSSALFEAENDARGIAFVTVFRAQMLYRLGDLESAERTARSAVERLRALPKPEPKMEGRALTELGKISAERGEYAGARAQLDNAISILTTGGGYAFYAAGAHEQVFRLAERTQDTELMRTSLEQMLVIHRDLGSARVRELTEQLAQLTDRS